MTDNMTDKDISDELQQQVERAYQSKTALRICAGNSKRFYGHPAQGETLDISAHQGVINYEPTELVITARAGTPLKLLQHVLDEQNQMFAFEPPFFAESATLGGTIACNLSGPRRAFCGAARDYVLGCTIVNGKGERLRFGGEVMKNVAGYDVSRLMCGAMGTLGAILEVSIKVLPKPETEVTLVQELGVQDSLLKVHQLARQPLPLSASCFDDNTLHIRLSGSQESVKAARKLLGGEELKSAGAFWQQLKEQQQGYFKSEQNLWRLSLASNSPQLTLKGKTLYEWNGAQRWLISDEDAQTVRDAVSRFGGHATCFRPRNNLQQLFHPLDPGLLQLHRRVKQAFDPHGICNPGKMYPQI